MQSKLPTNLLTLGAIFLMTAVAITNTIIGGSSPTIKTSYGKWDSTTRLSTVLNKLGEPKRLHAIENLDSTLIEKGRALLTKGQMRKSNGKLTSRQSKYYNCTHCHNLQRENPDLSNPNPEDRLDFAIQNDLPFLQGTTLYGVVNRDTYYNGDYQEKYGADAKAAHDTLVNAIQLCATTCSQGRKLTDAEMEAVLHFLWSIELKLGDLDLDNSFMAMLNRGRHETDKKPKLLDSLKKKYYTGSPASFADALPRQKIAMGQNGDPETGRAIYEKSCRQCHKSGGPTRYTLDFSILTFNELTKHLDDYKDKSIYQMTRYGTSPKKGYRPYMPQYPLERLSRNQVEDLAAFIRKQSSREP